MLPLRHVKPANIILNNCSCCKQLSWRKAQSVLFAVHEVTWRQYDWLVITVIDGRESIPSLPTRPHGQVCSFGSWPQMAVAIWIWTYNLLTIWWTLFCCTTDELHGDHMLIINAHLSGCICHLIKVQSICKRKQQGEKKVKHRVYICYHICTKVIS